MTMLHISVFLHLYCMEGSLKWCIQMQNLLLDRYIQHRLTFSISYQLTLMQILADQGETGFDFFFNSYCIYSMHACARAHTHVLNLVCFVQSCGVKDSSVFCIKIKQWVVIVTIHRGSYLLILSAMAKRGIKKRRVKMRIFPLCFYIVPNKLVTPRGLKKCIFPSMPCIKMYVCLGNLLHIYILLPLGYNFLKIQVNNKALEHIGRSQWTELIFYICTLLGTSLFGFCSERKCIDLNWKDDLKLIYKTYR